jgi:hypothetical protein
MITGHKRPPMTRMPRYSIAAILVAMAVVAVAAATLRLLPGLFYMAAVLLVASIAPVSVATLALYCRGYRRTFFAAALAGFFWPLAIIWQQPRAIDARDVLGLLLIEAAAGAACGFTATSTRRFLEHRRWHLTDDPPL